MTDYTELERLAYISGQPELAELYDKAAALDAIDLDEIKEHTYNQGFAAGEMAASNAELLAEIADLKERVQALETTRKEMYDSYAYFLNWLNGSDAKLAANRKKAVRDQEINLLRWRK